MRSRFDQGSEAGYAFYGGMLNAGYITGFARRTEGKTFVVQQTNDPMLALPVYIQERGISCPQDTMPIKVIGRFIGRKLETGERVLDFRAITLDRPSIRELPNRLAWEKTAAPGDSMDAWKPFFDPMDAEEVSPFYKGEKRNGRPCLNVARIAGYIESFAYKPATGGDKNDCLYIALRQTENPDESLPVRLYGRFTEAYKKQIQIALPIFIEGFYRVKKENRGTPDNPIWQSVPYIFCSKIKVATSEEIKVRPEWWVGMKDRLLRMGRDRIAAAKGNETKDDVHHDKPPETPKVEVVKPPEIPKPPIIDTDLDGL